MNKIYYTWRDVERQTQDILRQMQLDGWRPDYVVGLTRGGLIPANLISQYLGCPMECLKVSLRDDASPPEHNCWMSEDAFGYGGVTFDGDPARSSKPKKILIVDDINDTGATLNWIKKDWKSSCLPDDPKWKDIWNKSVRVATLVDNESSKSKLDVNYSAVTVNKADKDVWIVFPWEEWWK